MANFPTSLPSITNPTANDTLAAVAHHTQHGTANDEIAAIATKIGTGSSSPVARSMLIGNGTGTSKWASGPLTIGHFGTAAGDGVTDDTTVAVASDQSAYGPVHVPKGSYLTTRAQNAFRGPYSGPGQFIDSDGNKRGPILSVLASRPTLGDGGSVLTAFNGDPLPPITIERRVINSGTLGTPTTGYTGTEEASAVYVFGYNNSGYQHDTVQPDGRTGASAVTLQAYQAGQGDYGCLSFSVTVGGTNKVGGLTTVINPAGFMFNGGVTAIQDGVTINVSETQLIDGGYDVHGAGYHLVSDRENDTGALGAWWYGFRSSSVGSKAIDNAFQAVGPHRIGLDLSFAELPSSGDWKSAAIALKGAHRIYLDASGVDTGDSAAYRRYPTTAGSVYIDYSSSRINLAGADVNLSSGSVLKVNGTQVVGARDTGWTAMTGTPDESTSYAVSTVTLPQLAARVAALQAALTTHGLIGA